MATPAQTQITLDASQFLASVDLIGKAITDMNQELARAGTAFNQFANSSISIENHLQKISLNAEGTVNGLNALFNATKQATSVQQSMSASLLQVATSSERTAKALEQMSQASIRTGQAGAKGAQAFTFAWDGIFRLLAVTVIRRLFLDIAGGIAQAVQASADYQEQVGRIVALNQNLGVSADDLAGRFTNLSLAYGRSLKDTADIGRIAATSGGAQTVDQIDAITNSSMRLAEVSGSTGSVAATAITAISRAFHLTAEESQNVSNQLIHLTQSGIGMEAINGSIGRVSAQAQRLGVSFSEMGLLMETLKATGISDAEVMTQLAAVFTSLERPTERMRALMAGEGIFSGQQLIQAQRLGGALQFINREISEENIQARQAVQSRRAGGGLSVADEFVQRSQNNPLENVDGLNQTANAALRVVDATGRWNDELEKIKTIFTSEIAPEIIKSILEITDRAGGLANVVADVGRLLGALAQLTGLVVSGAVLIDQYVIKAAESLGFLDASTRQNRESMAAFNTAAREAMELTNTWFAAQRQISQQTLQVGTQAIANTFTPLNAALNRQSELQRERVHNLGESIEASSKQIFNAFGAQIEVLESIARQAESRIIESLKRVGEFADKTDKDMFSHRLKSLADVSQTTPFTNVLQQNNAAKLLTAQNNATLNQLNLIRDRRQRLQQEIAQLEANGDQASAERARERFQQLRQLNDQEMDIRQGSAKRNAEFTSRASGADTTFNPFNREREAGARRLNAAEEAFEAARRRRLTTQEEILGRINRELREQFRLVQNGQRDVGRLPQTLINPQGIPNQNFQGTRGAATATTQINDTIDNQIRGIRGLPASIEAAIAEALRRGAITPQEADQARRRAPSSQEVEALVLQTQQLRVATTALFQTAEARRVNQSNQQAQIGLLQVIARNTDKSITEASQARQVQINLLRQAQGQLSDARSRIPADTLARRATTNIGILDLERQLRETISNTEGLGRVATATGKPEDIVAFQEATREVARQVDFLARVLRIPGSEQGTAEGVALRETMTRLTEAITVRNQAEAALAQNQQTQRNATNAAVVTNAQNAGATALGIATNVGSAITTGVTELARPFSLLVDSVTAVADRLRVAATTQPIIPPPQIIEGHASGGLIGNTFSSFGPDNTMIHARRGEFVVNPEDTRKWYSTLVAINRGDRPRGGGYAHGGTVTNTIGNMTFHVNGGESPQETAHAVMKIIRREQRRGNA